MRHFFRMAGQYLEIRLKQVRDGAGYSPGEKMGAAQGELDYGSELHLILREIRKAAFQRVGRGMGATKVEPAAETVETFA